MDDDERFILSCETSNCEELQHLINCGYSSNSKTLTYVFSLCVENEIIEILQILIHNKRFKFDQKLIDATFKKYITENNHELIYLLQQFISPTLLSEEQRNYAQLRQLGLVHTSIRNIVSVTESLKMEEIEKRIREMKLCKTKRESNSARLLEAKLIEESWISNTFIECLQSNYKLILYRMLRLLDKNLFSLVNDSFIEVVLDGNFSMAHVLAFRVTSNAFNTAFIECANENNVDSMLWLLSGRVYGLYPTQDVIDDAFRQATIAHNTHTRADDILRILRRYASPYLVMEEDARRNKTALESNTKNVENTKKIPRFHQVLQDTTPEIHSYARSSIGHQTRQSNSFTLGLSHSKTTLNDRIIQCISNRVNGQYLNFNEIAVMLSQLIDDMYPPNATDSLEINRNAIKAERILDILRQGLNPTTAKNLGLTLKFLQMFPVESSHIWMIGFLGESVEMHSCIPGAMERMITGLRGIGDAELDEIFSSVEGPQLVRIFLSHTLNIYYNESNPESKLKAMKNSKKLASQLISRGVSVTSSVQYAMDVLRDYAIESISQYRVNYNDYKSDLDCVIEAISDGYTEYLFPYIEEGTLSNEEKSETI
jgi:hypothetical protein